MWPPKKRRKKKIKTPCLEILSPQFTSVSFLKDWLVSPFISYFLLPLELSMNFCCYFISAHGSLHKSPLCRRNSMHISDFFLLLLFFDKFLLFFSLRYFFVRKLIYIFSHEYRSFCARYEEHMFNPWLCKTVNVVRIFHVNYYQTENPSRKS